MNKGNFRVYMVRDRLFYVQRGSEIIEMKYPPVDVPDKTAYAHVVVDELNRQYAQ